MLFGSRARGRVDVESGVREGSPGNYESGVWCVHGVSIWEHCDQCVAATGIEPPTRRELLGDFEPADSGLVDESLRRDL